MQSKPTQSSNPSTWLAPGQCTRCRRVFDSGPVEVVARYADCTVFKCPGCGASIDDRPIGWGGSFKPMSREEAAGHLAGESGAVRMMLEMGIDPREVAQMTMDARRRRKETW